MDIKYCCVNEWPLLVWLTKINHHNIMNIWHGSGVEKGEQFVVEGVWDGNYRNGNMDKTDIFFGSGVRVRGDEVYFVSSCATVDRLVYTRILNDYYISNSLPCLLAATDINIDIKYKNHSRDIKSIIGGIQKYEKRIKTDKSIVNVCYYNNLCYKENQLKEIPKPFYKSRFDDFLSYKNFLVFKLQQIDKNAGAKERKNRFSFVSTISTGYDSVTVSTLLKEIGHKNVLSFARARSGYLSPFGRNDSGELISSYLGLNLKLLKEEVKKKNSLDEIYFFVFDPEGEDANFSSLGEHIKPYSLLFTGFHGDKIWDMKQHDVSPFIVRGDTTGLGLCEYRLKVGFIHCPITFIAVSDAKTIYFISKSEELKPWSLGNSYDRPICRRIIEEASVPRGLFGKRKKATTLTYIQPVLPSNPICRQRFYQYLKDENICSSVYLKFTILIRLINRILDPFRTAYWRIFSRSFSRIRTKIDGLVFPWAVNEHILLYKRAKINDQENK